jgi:uncharacterized membrane protein YfcA
VSTFSLESALLLVLLGIGVGAYGTLIGAGGGFVLTPVLLILYPHDSPQTLTAISLFVVFFNAGSGSSAYFRQRRVDWHSGIWFGLATLPGAVGGALLVAAVSRRVFDPLMAAALAVLALWLVSGHEIEDEGGEQQKGTPRRLVDRSGHVYEYRARIWQGVVYSTGVGFFSSFLGIGGGIIHVPLLVRALGFPVHVATATSHFVLAIMSGSATVTHVLAGSFAHGHGLHRAIALSIGVIVGAQLGALLSSRIRGRVIEWLLAVGLAALSLRLILLVILG